MEAVSPVKPVRNASIDLMRLPAALLVVLNHTGLFLDVNTTLGHYVSTFLPRFTLPFFLAVSGYYFVGNLLDGRMPLKRNLLAIVKPYLLWSLLYYLASFVVNVVMGSEPLGKFLVDRVIYLFTSGSYFQLWYFPALIYSMIIVNGVFRLLGRRGLNGLTVLSFVLLVVGILGSAYVELGRHIPVLSQLYAWSGFGTLRGIFLMGLPYFLMGHVLRLWKEGHEPRMGLLTGLLVGAVALYFGEMTLLIHLNWVERPEVMVSTYWLTLTVFAMLLRCPLPQYGRQAQWCNLQSGFVYFVHGLVLIAAKQGAAAMGLPLGTLPLTVLVIVVSMLLGQVCLWWRNPFTGMLLGKGGTTRAQA